jgi:phospholipid/cholesterol/gamma-HCH transport system substrate-binding protein
MKRFFLKIFGGPVVHGHQTLSAWKLGVGFLVGVLVVGWAVFNKAQLSTWLHPGDTIKVHFASDYRLRPYFSEAKIAFVPVGMVTGVEEMRDRTALVSVKLYDGAVDRLGSQPSAVIRPTTLLGGNYFLDLEPGGDPGRFTAPEIPPQRTRVPVEMDKVAAAFQPDALTGMRGTLTKFDDTLGGDTKGALQRLVSDAPGALRPTGEVLDALRGIHPNTDLTDVVTGFEATARQLAEPNGRLDAILTDLATLSTSFGDQSQAFSTALHEMPPALHSAERGLNRLDTTLDVLRETAPDIRPSARELSTTLEHVNPVLDRARPVVADLRDLLGDAQPLLRQLRPDTRDLTDVLDDLRGPVLDRVNGPISDLIHHPYHGAGPYAQTSTDKPIFEELGYAVADLDRATTMDRNGAGIAFEAQPVPEAEGLVANSGQPRDEAMLRSLVAPFQIAPPVQAPVRPRHPQPNGPTLPMLFGDSPAPAQEDR